jgi:hypothetical protein
MCVKHVKAFSDSLLVVQQVASVFQCFDGSLNAYLDKYMEIIALFNDFIVHHVSRDERHRQMIWHNKHQVSDRIEENLVFWKNKMFRFAKLDSPVFGRCTVWQSILQNQVQQNLMF